jgi:hypothetical protein
MNTLTKRAVILAALSSTLLGQRLDAAPPGVVVGWGLNNYGQASIPPAAQSGVIALAGGAVHSLALKTNGTIVTWGNTDSGQSIVPPAAQTGVSAIAAGANHSLALKTNGAVVAWGNNFSGQATVPPAAQSGVIAIAGGSVNSVALKTNGSVIVWGDNFWGQNMAPPAAQNGVMAIDAGNGHILALKTNGTVISWGENGWGQTDVPPNAQTGVVAIAAGYFHSLALKNDGSVVAWGHGVYGQTAVPPAAQSGVISIAAGWGHSMALRSDGTLVSWGYNSDGQVAVPIGFTNGLSIEAGGYHNLALVNPTPLAIIQEPSDTIADAGVAAIFAVQVTGFPRFYQWRFNGADLPGATASFLYLPNVLSNNVGQYSVVVSNSLGSVTSTVANLTVNYRPPTLSFSVSGRNPALVGDAVQFCAFPNAAPPAQLQWHHNGTNVPGATNPCLYLTLLQTNQSGVYTIIASNAAGMATNSAVLTVIEPPPAYAYVNFPSTQPAAGDYLSLCSIVTIAPPYRLQWQFNGADIAGETNTCLNYPSVSSSNNGLYTIVASNASGAYTSPPVAIQVIYYPPAFSFLYYVQGSPDALVGNDISLCGFFAGSPSRFQWQFNGSDLPGQTNNCLTLFQITSNAVGAYTLIASNLAGMATSSVQNITVRSQAPAFAYHPYNLSVAEGSNVRMTAHALAGPPATHTLQFNGTNIGVPYIYVNSVGGFSLLDVTPADAGNYRVIASNVFGMATSSVATLTITPAGPLDRWMQRNPLPQSQPILSVCHGTNQFVAVGERGTIMNSPDGTNWIVQSRRVDLPLHGVAYGGGRFVAAGDGGTILTSPDGTNWAYTLSVPNTEWLAVAFGEGRFVVVGDSFGPSTLVATSTNGVDWERTSVAGVNAKDAVTFGQGKFVAGGNSSIIYSVNGVDWTLATSVASEIESLFHTNGLFVAAGDNGSLLVSSNGLAWSARTSGTTRSLRGITYGDGKWIAVGSRGAMITSPDGLNWVAANSGTPDRLETIDFQNGIFVALGENGTTITSTDGTAWTKRNFGTTRDLDGMAVGNGTLVVVGKFGTILTSTNGEVYTAQNAGVTNDLHGVAFGGGLWVAVGEPGVVLTSSNAVQWTSRASGTTNSLKDGTWANGKWIVVGTRGTVLTSSNGIDWSASTVSPAFDLNDVAYGNGLYRIAGDGAGGANGSLFTSANGTTWSVLYPFIGKNLRGITFAEDRFVIAANDGMVVTMPSGGNTTFGQRHYQNLRAVARTHGLWVIVGNFGTILTTAFDPTNNFPWIERPSRTFENLHQVAYLDGKLVAIGNRGTILQSGRFVAQLGVPTLGGGGAQIPFKGVLKQGYRLEASTDLMSWTNLFSFTNTTDQLLLQDTNAAQHSRRFYRAVGP